MRMGGHDLKLKGLKRALRQQQARLYIIRRCVVMLITRSD
ncbi:hypothetical protein BDA96_02G169900 [Sorghum bicolor]|uniref:Uncharacterized protein n=2 Tax=Sorghum bicolor TaxID=4558 RepID=A0A921RPD9_SORBI|nr:hypothetical protein BDA96_02G169900 [Sorghum bicolor]OQU89239.1 hypothetical protein SORBI_3002G163200 [Sorghum bicolor]